MSRLILKTRDSFCTVNLSLIQSESECGLVQQFATALENMYVQDEIHV